MKLRAIADESYCFGAQAHVSNCNGKTHACGKCGMFLGMCDARDCGSLLDQ